MLSLLSLALQAAHDTSSVKCSDTERTLHGTRRGFVSFVTDLAVHLRHTKSTPLLRGCGAVAEKCSILQYMLLSYVKLGIEFDASRCYNRNN